MDNLAIRIKAANWRLKENYCRIRIEMIGGRLYLRGIFPPKPKALDTQPHQQRISAADANFQGLKQAEKMARVISTQLDANTFKWDPFIKQVDKNKNSIPVEEWISHFEEKYFQGRERNYKTETTWKKDYLAILNRFDPAHTLCHESIMAVVNTTRPNTRARKRCVLAISALLRFADIDIDLSALSGNYSPNSRQPRELPSDQTIVSLYEQIKDERWQYVFGLMATYGLRNHESFFICPQSLANGKILKVLNGKTGPRKIWPLHPEWFDRFELRRHRLPNINLNRSNSAIGAAVSQRFKKTDNLGIQPYDLRHAWAVRSLEYGIDISLCAMQMGHSLDVHSQIYHTWISDAVNERAFIKAVCSPNKPIAPV